MHWVGGMQCVEPDEFIDGNATGWVEIGKSWCSTLIVSIESTMLYS